MAITLTKAHAYGNDFLLVRAAELGRVASLPAFVREICDRHRGVGADGLMIIEETPEGATTRLFNADGSTSELSGNGVRCVGAWLGFERNLSAGDGVVIGTGAGPKALTFLGATGRRCRFRASMGPPEGLEQVPLEVAGQHVTATVMRVGNPQCVVLGPLSPERLHTVAARLAVHPHFPAGTNVELAHVEAPDRVRILIWERGVGPTEASGTGACAAAVAAAAFGGAGRRVSVVAPGGTQLVEWTEDDLWLTGECEVLCRVEWWG
ncbi:MAG TPA: diaminopimelate epimerase [Vicinamibacterales bacterium]|nr:diaminopimelate epimerase [Vicinamibacterales bacterium]